MNIVISLRWLSIDRGQFEIPIWILVFHIRSDSTSNLIGKTNTF